MRELPEGIVLLIAFTAFSGYCGVCGGPTEVGNTSHWTQGGLGKPAGCGAYFTHIAADYRRFRESESDGGPEILPFRRPDLTYIGEVYLQFDENNRPICRLV